jgi:menaquinone reductase, multiheme cytochrome c subunit
MEKPRENVTSAAPGHGEKEEGAGGPVILFFILGLVASLLVGWILFPRLLYSTKRQPVDFNHVKHMELVSDGCESCHFFRPDGTYSGVPQLAQCIQCHEEANGDDPEEVKFVEEYVKKGREVPWLVYSRQPACVFFSHAAHVKMAQMDCVTCHGPIGESENLRPYQENRISGYSRDIWGKNSLGLRRNSWDRMKMDVCAECHAGAHVNPGSVQTQKDGCFVCHK